MAKSSVIKVMLSGRCAHVLTPDSSKLNFDKVFLPAFMKRHLPCVTE
jgi:hypothetical protein